MKMFFGLFLAFVFTLSLNINIFAVPRPSDTVKTFYQDICGGDFIKAKQQLSSTVRLHKSVIDLAFEVWNKSCKSAGGLKGFNLRNKLIDFKTAGVIGDVLFNGGSKESIQMKLFRESRKWRIAWEIR